MSTIENHVDWHTVTEAARCASSGARIVLEIDGHRVALVPVEDAEYMEALEDARDLEKARQALAEPGESIPVEEIMRELGIS